MKAYIKATDDAVEVTVGGETFSYETPGMLTGCDLRDVLAACGIETEYSYEE